MARKAHDKMVNAGACPGDYDEWRREEQMAAVGIESLRACDQSHYTDLYNHFSMIAGIKTKVDKTFLINFAPTKRLIQAMQRGGYDMMYLEEITKDKFPGRVDFSAYRDKAEMYQRIRLALEWDEIIQLVATVNNRARVKERRASGIKWEFNADT